MKKILLLLLLVVGARAADVVPAAAQVTWTPNIAGGVGVVGGIPTNYTQSGSTITSTGDNTDRTATIQAALDTAGSGYTEGAVGKFVLLGPNNFAIFGTLNIPSGVVLRGAGSGQLTGEASTGLVNQGTGGTPISMGIGDFAYNGTAQAISGTITKGTTSLTVADSSSFILNSLAFIYQSNDTGTNTLPIVNLANGGLTSLSRQQLVQVTAIPDGTHITISPGLSYTMQSGLSPKARALKGFNNGYKANSGVENLIIDQTNTASPPYTILAWGWKNGWIKNVKSVMAHSYHMFLDGAYNCEIRHCFIDNAQSHVSNGSGLITYFSANCLLEDNIIQKVFPSIEINHSTMNCVVAYNYCRQSDSYSGAPSAGLMGASIDINHDTHNSFNLYEGNGAPNEQNDGYFGSTSNNVIARNWFYGTSPDTTNEWFCVGENRFSRGDYIVGNILGTVGFTWIYRPTSGAYGQTEKFLEQLGYPNMGARDFSGTASLSTGSPWADWAAYLTNTYSGGGGRAGFQEFDLDVLPLNTLLGNYNVLNAAIPAGESLGGSTVATSYFRSSKPLWFGSLPWPAYDAASPVLSIQNIPAGYRYVNGAEPPAGSVNAAKITNPFKTRLPPAPLF